MEVRIVETYNKTCLVYMLQWLRVHKRTLYLHKIDSHSRNGEPSFMALFHAYVRFYDMKSHPLASSYYCEAVLFYTNSRCKYIFDQPDGKTTTHSRLGTWECEMLAYETYVGVPAAGCPIALWNALCFDAKTHMEAVFQLNTRNVKVIRYIRNAVHVGNISTCRTS